MLINSSKLLFYNTMTVGVMVSISSNNWFMIWAGMEVSLMSLIPIISHFNMFSSESSMKYFIIQGMSSSVLILGLILMLSSFKNYVFLIFVSMIIKLGMAPFHNWVLVMVDGLSYISNFILLTLMKIAPLIVLSYMNVNCMIPVIMSMIVGSMFALNQSSIRKILAYSSIFNLAFLGSCLNMLSMWLIYLIIYSFILFSVSLFMMSINVNYMNQLIINDFNVNIKIGLWIVILSLSGIPPLAGFMSKLMVFELLISQENLLLISLMIFTSLLVTFYYMRILFLSMMFSSMTLKWMKFSLNYFSLIWPLMNLMTLPMLLMAKMLN